MGKINIIKKTILLTSLKIKVVSTGLRSLKGIRKKILLFIRRPIGSLILTLCFVGPVYADVVWPALYLASRMVAWWAIVAGLVIEYLFVRKLTGFSIPRSIIVDFSMNAASALLGTIFIPIAGIAWEIFAGIVYKGFGTFNPGTWIATGFFAAFINAFIENFIISRFFKYQLGWRGFWWLSLANGLSVAVALFSLFIFPP